KPQLKDADNQNLFDTLLSKNGFDRAQARRVLMERGSAIIADLDKWMAKQTDEQALLQALWLKEAFDQVDVELLGKVLAAKDGRGGAAGVRGLGNGGGQVPSAQPLLSERLADEHPRVRLEAVRAIARIPSAAAADAALPLLDKPMDRFLEYGLW